MWSNDNKPSDKTSGRMTTRIPMVRRDPMHASADPSVGAYPRTKTRTTSSSLLANKKSLHPVRNRDRFGIRKTLDMQKVSETDVLGRRKPKKTKKDTKPFTGKLYREKTFGVFSTPSTSGHERPSNVPRRRLQTDESDTLDRGYVSDVKSEITRSFYQEKEEEFKVDRRIRPKSAGQALYHADSDDDSSLDGEIEVIDIDNDDTFIVIQDTVDSNLNVNTNFVSDQLSDRRKSLETVGHANRYYGNTENTSKHGRQLSGSESEKRDGRIHSDINPPNYTENTLSPATFDRRRVKSDSSALPLQDNYVDKRRESETFQSDSDGTRFIKKSNSVNNRQKSNVKSDALHPEIPTDKTYARAVENVLTKYSHMTVRAGNSSESSHPGRFGSRAGENHLSHGQRASLPRKLKPLLNREKLGHVNQDQNQMIDYPDSSSKNTAS
ncbi:hypothetical protein LOTGIDRAFT_169436 [Lottia gigantea]|uniref:Uncharacterized protein n=1 Tax=Lottia gigantea TaxID=225164 RepID=V3ZGV0_LOTGI|nr:hypothetical protein LOTGIDRAFT_169436 [Lottia gigantea]ESO83367.1 hypothetical protein LOTGIDRAFT_169436 [Lottia gigantea]